MTTAPRDLVLRRPADVVPARQDGSEPHVNPHRGPVVITAASLIPTAVAAVHSANAVNFNVAVGAVIAAIFAFMVNLFRWQAFEEAHPR